MPPPKTVPPVAPDAVTESAANADTRTHPFPLRTPAGASQQTAPPPEVGTGVGTFVLQEKLAAMRR